MTVAVVYFSEKDTTHQVAEAISEGVEKMSCQYHLLRVTGEQIVDGRFVSDEYLHTIDRCDAVIFGCPTYMGGPAAQFKAFCDKTSDRWDDQSWSGKFAAGFTVGSNPGGDQLATLQYFAILAAQHGMLWVNHEMPSDHEENIENKLNAQMGFAGVVPGDTISKRDVTVAARHGSRVALFSKRYSALT